MTKSKWHWSLIVVSLLLLLSLTAGCLKVTIPDQPAQTSGFLTYTDSTNGFSIAYPKDWQKMPQELLPEEAIVGFFRGINHPDPSSYNVIAGEWSSGMTVEDLYSALKSNYETTMEGYSFISKDNLTINGIPAIKHTCTLRTGGQTRKAIQVLLVNNNRAWFLTLGSPPEYFTQHESTFNTIINSFRLSGATTSIPPVQPAATTSGFLTYTDQVNGFSFSYPQGWEETPRQGLSAYTLIGFRSTKLEAGFAPNVNVVSEKLTSSMSISDYWEQQERQFNSLPAGTYTSPSIEYTDSNGLPAIKHIYTITTEGIQIKMIQLSVIQGNTAYTISCACATSVFSSYESTFNAIINSFRLLQPATTAPSTGLLTYTDSANGFSIAYPQDWQKMPQELLVGENMVVAFWRGTGHPDTSKLSVSMSEWPSGMTVEDYYSVLKPELEKYNGYNFISKDNLTINGIPAIKHTCTFRTDVGQTVKTMMAILVKGNSAWLLTFGAPPEYFTQHESTFNIIAQSFKVLGTAQYVR